MQFKNAQIGLSRIFISEILQIIPLILFLVLAIISGSIDSSSMGNNVTSEGTQTISLIIVPLIIIFALIIYIVSVILMISGLYKAKLDEENFYIAFFEFIIFILSYLASYACSIFTIIPVWIIPISSMWITITKILFTFSLIKATNKLLAKQGKRDIAKIGKIFFVIFSISQICKFFTSAYSSLSDSQGAFHNALEIIMTVCVFIGDAFLVIFLWKAKKNLSG